jgi:6,7-dimethyl-8-ribityllumazine synthase
MDQIRDITGSLNGAGRRFAVVASRFNSRIGDQLVAGALECLRRHGVEPGDIQLVRVPGAWEIPQAAEEIAAPGKVDALVALGVVIRGETPHFDYIASEAASGLQLAAIETGVPVSFGVLTVENRRQAEERIDRAADAVRSALEMADVFSQLRAQAAGPLR